MAIKINKIHIENFKIFHKQTFDFTNSDLNVLDGPNGFGKTSFYDAIELLITGKIRRYEHLAEVIIGKSQKVFNENPFLNSEFKSGDIIIEGRFNIDGDNITLIRKANNDELENTHSFNCFKLYSVSKSGDETFYSRDNEEQFLKELFGSNYRKNFNFLNYVEQEEATFLLKNKEKNKKDMIAHLFDVENFQNKINVLKNIKDKISKLCIPSVKQDVSEQKNNLKGLKEKSSQKEEVNYIKLFKNSSFDWDDIEITFPENRYNELLGEDGILTRLKSLITNKTSYKYYRFNNFVNKILDEKNGIEQLIRFYAFSNQKDDLVNKKKLLNDIGSLIIILEKISLDNIQKGDITINEKIRKDVIKDENLLTYDTLLKNIKDKQKKLSDIDSILVGLKDSRQTLKLKFEEYQKEGTPQKECPLCGHEWQDVLELATKINTHTEKINNLLKGESEELAVMLSYFKSKELNLIIDQLKGYQNNNKLDDLFVNSLKSIDFINLNSLKERIEKIGVSIDDYLCNIPNLKEQVKKDELIQVISEKLRDYNEQNIKGFYNDLFIELFNNTKTKLDDVTLKDINLKIAYTEWKYSIYQNSEIAKLEETISINENQYDRANELKVRLAKLERIYKNSLDIHNKQVIKDIEILFHIYSGRIVQDYQGGLGLFIDNKKGIKFLTNPSKSYDALFSMSSGQLSALIISFTLALNKKYSQNKVLFIDDPVQTMDELNIAGFIDLLRNEFTDRQIFISTHEEIMSSYMRYKFEKYGHKTLRIDVKELYNSVS